MPPKPCPRRLQRLIADDPQSIRLILRALEDRRHNKGPETLPLQSLSQVTINLTDYSITVRNELQIALAEIDLPRLTELIRECPVCQNLFWAGRIDKVACNRHAEQWRKIKQRQRQKADAKQRAGELKDAQLKANLQRLSRTAVALLNAIVISGQQYFYKIDYAAWRELKDDPTVRRVTNTSIVRLTLGMLVNRGYLTDNPHRNDPDYDLYFPEPHLIKAWKEMRRKRGGSETS